ncbi:MAG: CBS domain-containing protein, partial [Candidatus Acidiferrales bacterium]
MIAYLISRRYQKVALYDMLALQDGISLPSIERQREQIPLSVENAMQRDRAQLVGPAESVADVLGRAGSKPDTPLLIRAAENHWRLLDREDLKRLAAESTGRHLAVEAVSAGPLPVLFPDQSLEEALQILGDWPLIPVVSRANVEKLEGVVTLADVLRTFRNAPGE